MTSNSITRELNSPLFLASVESLNPKECLQLPVRVLMQQVSKFKVK